MLKFFLWVRYLQKRRIVFLSMAAVAISVALLIIVSSVFGGFIKAVTAAGRETFGDIQLNVLYGIPDYRELQRRLEGLPEVEATAMQVETSGLLRLGMGDVRAVRVIGIDAGDYSRVTALGGSLIGDAGDGELSGAVFEEREGKVGGFVSIGLLEGADEETDEYDFEGVKAEWLGKEVVLTTGVSLKGEESQSKPKARYSQFYISDIVFAGMHMRDTTEIYLPYDTVISLMRASEGEVVRSSVLIKMKDGVDRAAFKDVVESEWNEYAAAAGIEEGWQRRAWTLTSEEIQQLYLEELNKQLAMLMLIFGIVCSSAVMLIFCIFYMLVMTRRKDIAVIKSCGAGWWTVAALFAGFGACIGILGSVFGVLLGWVVTLNINFIENIVRVLFGLKLWKSSVYMFDKIPNQLEASAAGWIVCAAIIASIVGALIPAIIAARTKPVNILRYE